MNGLYQAGETIHATGTVPPEGIIQLKAGTEIKLDVGFGTDNQVIFSAEIEDCGGN